MTSSTNITGLVKIKCIWLTQVITVILIFIEMVTFGRILKSMQMETLLIF